MSCVVGVAWVFEKGVVYGSPSDLLSTLRSRTAKSRFGEFIGVVKGLIPIDPYYVLYEYLQDSPSFLLRQRIRRHNKKLGITRLERRGQQKLTIWKQNYKGIGRRR